MATPTWSDKQKLKSYIPEGAMVNKIIADWQGKQPRRGYHQASPSGLTMCPRVIWLDNQKVPYTNEMGWGVRQRLQLGRIVEDFIAMQFQDEGVLLKHWKDNPGDVVEQLVMGEGENKLTGTPDYIIDYNGRVAVADGKTSRSDSFQYVPIEPDKIWEDEGWFRYKMQLTAYYMLCHANADWFKENKIPLPEICVLFSYALDDGIVRREIAWTPTEEDMDKVKAYTRQYNKAVIAETMPACKCNRFDTLFCNYGIKPEGSNVCTSCCSDDLIKEIK
jgi:hypothetical protein